MTSFLKNILASAALLFTVAVPETSAATDLSSRDIVSQMTTQEKAELVVGRLWDMDNASKSPLFDYPGLGMPISGVARFGLPVTICSDGSYGLKKYIKMGNGKYGTTAFPIPIGMASSWNPSVAKEVAVAYGNEGKEYGVDILLGPAMNIMRDPLCGRNFEYYSEDPLLSGFMASAYVDGIQSNGVGATLKHFAANNQETDRIINDARVSVRALREIYLRGFEHTVKYSHPWSLMTAYSRINGVQCGENSDLIEKVARGDWGFDGVVMTDFGGKGWTPLQVQAGNDLVMPGSTYHVQNILNGLKNGELTMKALDECCVRIIDYIKKTQHYKGYKYSKKPDLTAHAAIARRAAAETFVLLKNNGALPLQNATPAFFGTGSYDTRISGIGSGKVTSDYRINIADGFEKKNTEIADWYDTFISQGKRKATKGMKMKQKNKVLETLLLPEMLPGADTIKNIASKSSIGIYTITRNAGEGADRRPVEGDWLLTKQEKETMRQLADAYHAQGKKLIVLLNVPGPMETASWKDIPDAIMIVWLPGQEGGNAIADVLTGNVSPSGKLTVTLPNRYEDCPTYGNFPTGNEGKTVDYDKNGYQADADNMKKRDGGNAGQSQETIFENGKTRLVDPPKDQWVKNINYTNYDEGVYVGYRYYTTKNKPVSYPFGFGLSYTTFKYSNMTVKPIANGYEVTVSVTNTGKRAGKEVVEVYMHAPAIKESRPVKELVAFGKTRNLKPCESETLKMTVMKRDLAWFDENSSAWTLEKGKYTMTCAPSAVDKGVSKTVTVAKRAVLEKTSRALLPR